jgi:hypothetical protein
MFSQAQLNTFGAALERKRISQQTFDEAVQENIEEFDMEVWIFCSFAGLPLNEELPSDISSDVCIM